MFWLPVAAVAAPADDSAEVARLGHEMERLAARGAWDGVDRAYRAIEALRLRGAAVPASLHLLGAHASQARGQMSDTWKRLMEARKLEPVLATLEWLSRIEVAYGPVDLVARKGWEGFAVLEALDPGMAPDERSTIQAAKDALRDERRYNGLLPLGRYRVGDQTFEVIGGPLVLVELVRGTGPATFPEEPVVDVVAPPPPAEPIGPPTHYTLVPLQPASLSAHRDWVTAARAALLGITNIQSVTAAEADETLRATLTRPGLGRLGRPAAAMGPILAEALSAELVAVDGPTIILRGTFGADEPLRQWPLTSASGSVVPLAEAALLERSGIRAAVDVTTAPGADPTAVEAEIRELLSELPMRYDCVRRPQVEETPWGGAVPWGPLP